MRQKSVNQKPSSEQIVKDIRRATRKQYSAEEIPTTSAPGWRSFAKTIAPSCVQRRRRARPRIICSASFPTSLRPQPRRQ
jgi:hypothetical protein